MASSYEISQMFAQQNQMFMGANQRAQSIGVPPPPSIFNQVGMGNQGVGAYGFGGFGPSNRSFSYGAPQWAGYGPGNSMAAGMMAGANAGLQGGSMLLGGAALLGIGGAPVAAAATLAAPAAIAGGFMAHGAHQQSQMNTMLGSQYQFFNPASRSGSGFTRDDSKAIGDSVRQLSHIPEMMTSVDELTKIASRLKSSGVMQGVRSAADFQARFKEAISTIRDTAKILGSTMEEAEQFFSQSRGAGFYGRTAQLKNAVSAQFTSAVTGANLGQVMAAQQGGADMAMQYGARRGLGATAVNRMAQNIGLAQEQGRFSEGAIEDATGMSGPEGQLALAQKMFGGMMRFGQTAPGRLAMAGMMRYEGGRAVGVDEDLAKRFNMGLVGVDELKGRASRLSNAEKISFTNRQEDLVASLAGQIGPGGAYGMMKGVLGDRFSGDPEATKLVMRRLTGMTAGDTDLMEGMQGVSGDGMAGLMAQMKQRQSKQKETTDPKAMLQRIKTRLHSATVGKLEQAGADIQNAIAKEVDSFFDDVVGSQISTLTEERAKSIAMAFSGGQGGDAREMLKAATKIDPAKFKTGGAQGFGAKGGLSLGGRAGLMGLNAIVPGAGLAAMGISDAMTYLRNSGGEGGMARFAANLSGVQTEGQINEYLQKTFGTGDAKSQEALIKGFGSNMAGKGATSAITRIASQKGWDLKSDVEKLQAITGGLESNVRDALGKLPKGYDTPDKLKNLSEESVASVLAGSGLSEDEKSLVRSFHAASRNKVGGMNTFAQMAAASSEGIQGIMKNVAGTGSGSLGAMKAQMRAASEAMTDRLGGAAASYIQAGGAKASKAFQEVLQDESLRNYVTTESDPGKIQLKLAEKGIYMDDKEVARFKEATRSFSESKKDVQAALNVVQSFGEAANSLAKSEFRENLKKTGRMLGLSAKDGKIGSMQKTVSNALLALGERGDQGAIDDWRKTFSEYSKSFEGMSKDELAEALSSGGDIAQQAYNAHLEGKKGYSGKMTKSRFLKETGLSDADWTALGGQEGQVLTKEQSEKIAQLRGSAKALVGAQGMGSPTETKEQKLMTVLTKLDKNQEGIATLLATMSQDKALQGKIDDILRRIKENGSAGPGGNTDPGSELQSH